MLVYLEPLFFRGSGISASDADFTIIWRGISAPKKKKKFKKKKKKKINIHLYCNGDIGDTLALQ